MASWFSPCDQRSKKLDHDETIALSGEATKGIEWIS